jgi:hypothetical protein
MKMKMGFSLLGLAQIRIRGGEQGWAFSVFSTVAFSKLFRCYN